MKTRFYVLFVVVFLTAGCLHADTVLLGAPNAGTSSIWNLTSTVQAATEFTLSSSEYVTTIDVYFLGSVAKTFNYSLQDSLTGSINTFASASLTEAGLLAPELQTMTVNMQLAPGTYFLVGTTAINGLGGWDNTDGTLIQNAGTVTVGTWRSSDSGASWILDSPGSVDPDGNVCSADCLTAAFIVHGQPSAPTVPEPSSMALLAGGLASLACVVRRQRR